MNLNIYQFSWNEVTLIEFMYKKWKEQFPDAKFILLDNISRDGTLQRACDLGYSTFSYDTKEEFSDETNMHLSNNLPFSPIEICAICDMDELCLINQEELNWEVYKNNTTIIRFEGYNMFNLGDLGVRAPRYDKFIMFDHDRVKMRFGAGRHECYPTGVVVYSKKVYKLLHYGTWDLLYYLNRRRLYNQRWSEKNLQMSWGAESRLNEEQLIEKYNKNKEKAIKIL